MANLHGPILVTGATGNVGGPLVERLHGRGVPVRAAVRRTEEWAGPRDALCSPVRFDFADPRTYGPALEDVSRLFLLRPPQIADVRRYLFPVIDAAKAAGVWQIVFLSLLGAEHNPFVPHHKVENYLRRAGTGWTLLRPGFFMQNLTTTHRAEIAKQGEILVPAGRGRTSFIDAGDIAEAAARVLTEDHHLGRAYTLTGAEALDYYQVADILTAVLGKPVAYRAPSVWRFVRHLRRQGVPWDFVLVMTGIYLTTRWGMAAAVTGDLPGLIDRPPTTFRAFAEANRAAWVG